MIAIIGTLVAILLPAVQSAREGSRRMACTNSVRQLASGVGQFVSREGRFPTGSRYSKDFANGGQGMSFFIELLPYIGFQSLYDEFFRGTIVSGQESWISRRTISMFLCPSDVNVFPTGSGEQGRVNYRGNIGNLPGGQGINANNGIFVTTGGAATSAELNRVAPAVVLDGLSQTALLSERRLGDNDAARVTAGSDWFGIDDMRVQTPNPNHLARFTSPDAVHAACVAATPQAGETNQVSLSGQSWFYAQLMNVFYNHVSPPNGRSCVIRLTIEGGDPLESLTGSYRDDGGTATPPTSRHPGGVTFALADEATRFIADDVDLTIWRALGSRRSGEIIPDSWR